MPRNRLLLAVAGLVATAAGAPNVLAATAQGSPVPPTVVVEGNVRVLTYQRDALERAPQLSADPAPLVTMGGASGDPRFDLTSVSYVVPLADGRTLTFSRIGNHVYLFGRDGSGERVFGRTGQGPGEWMRFGDPQRLSGDTVLILDFGNSRINWMTADAGVVRTAPLNLARELGRLGSIAGVLSDGRVVAHASGSWGGAVTSGPQVTTANIVSLELPASTARVIASVPDLPGAQFETRYGGRARTGWMPLRLAGSARITVWDSLIVSTEAASAAITLRNAGGDVQSRLVLPLPRRAVTRAMRDTVVSRELARLSGPRQEAMVDPQESRRVAREAPWADSLPRFDHLFPSRDGLLWAVDAIAATDEGWTATAIRPDGAIAGRLRVRGTSMPMAFDGDRVIVRTSDADGVVSLQVLRIRPQP